MPFDLDVCADCLSQGLSKLYDWRFVRSLKAQYALKAQSVRLPPIRSIREWDDAVTAPIHGFDGAADYYARCSSGPFLRNIRVPTLILHAADDPFMNATLIPTEDALSEQVILELSATGGHVGFVMGTPFRPVYWLEQRIPEFLKTLSPFRRTSRAASVRGWSRCRMKRQFRNQRETVASAFVRRRHVGGWLYWLTQCGPGFEEWRQEALDANQQAVSAASETLQDGDTSQDHELRILGGSESTQPTQLGWAELQALPQTEVHTISPHQTGIKGTVYHYRGVAVSELLKHHGVAKTAQQVTFVAYDGFRSTVSVKDLMNYPILIATERNGRPIPRGEGGPILLVFYSEHPELASRYPDRWWVFYVNHLVVDTPSFEPGCDGNADRSGRI